MGAGFSALFLLIAAFRFLVYLVSGRSLPPPTRADVLAVAIVVPGYIAAFMVGGAVVAWMWPLRRRRAGAFGLGYLAAGIVCTALALLLRAVELDQSEDLIGLAYTAGIPTLGFGTLVGYILHRDWR